MASKIWLLVEWVEENNLFATYAVVNYDDLVFLETNLEPGVLVYIRTATQNSPRQGKIMRISENKTHIEEHKELLERQDEQYRNVLQQCMQSIQQMRASNSVRVQCRRPVTSGYLAPPHFIVPRNSGQLSNNRFRNLLNSPVNHHLQGINTLQSLNVSTEQYQQNQRREQVVHPLRGLVNTTRAQQQRPMNSSTPLPPSSTGSRRNVTLCLDQSCQTDRVIVTSVEYIDQMESILQSLYAQFMEFVAEVERKQLAVGRVNVSEVENNDNASFIEASDLCVETNNDNATLMETNNDNKSPIETNDDNSTYIETNNDNPSSIETNVDNATYVETNNENNSSIETNTDHGSYIETVNEYFTEQSDTDEERNIANRTDNNHDERSDQVIEENVVSQPLNDSLTESEDLANTNFPQSARTRTHKVRRLPAQTTNNINPLQSLNAEMVGIGNGHAKIPKRRRKKFNWNSYTTATRQLLHAVFPRSVLATHCLSGKRSPAFMNRPAKKILDPKLVEDIVKIVSTRCDVPKTLVRNTISIACTDEAKMYRNQQKYKQQHRNLRNDENTPPVLESSDESSSTFSN